MMRFFRMEPHHRWRDADPHDLRQLIAELLILAVIILLWPTE
jgi:hypothetical protein